MDIHSKAWSATQASATALVLLLCTSSLADSFARNLVAPTAAELPRHVLVLTETNGQVTHQWQRAEDIDLKQYHLPPSFSAKPDGRIVLVANRQRDCDEENRECVRQCMSRPLARGLGHMTSGGRKLGGKEAYCREECRQAYLDCSELQDKVIQKFSISNEAVVWLKEHYKALVVGGVFIISGVAFVTFSAGAGAVMLVPALLLAP